MPSNGLILNQPIRVIGLSRNQSGGGPMLDFGCHRIEVLLNILGPITSTISS
jgi:predicted dehydrogenase